MAEETNLACNEVWGGNEEADTVLDLPALRVRVFCDPHGDAPAGGDVHYVSSCGTGRIIRVLVADAMGHGRQASELAAYLRSLMRQFLNHVEPHSLATRVNELIHTRAGDKGGFATALIMTYFAPTGELSLCNAGHPAPVVYRRKRGEWTSIERVADETGPSNLPLGVLERGRYTARQLTLEEGDVILAYTDGLIEARDESSSQLDLTGLLDALDSLGDPHELSSPAELTDRLPELVRNRGYGLQEDDLSLVVLACTGRSTGVRWAQRWAGLRKLYRDWRAGKPIPRPEISIRTVGGAFISALNRVRPRRRKQQ